MNEHIKRYYRYNMCYYARQISISNTKKAVYWLNKLNAE